MDVCELLLFRRFDIISSRRGLFIIERNLHYAL